VVTPAMNPRRERSAAMRRVAVWITEVWQNFCSTNGFVFRIGFNFAVGVRARGCKLPVGSVLSRRHMKSAQRIFATLTSPSTEGPLIGPLFHLDERVRVQRYVVAEPSSACRADSDDHLTTIM